MPYATSGVMFLLIRRISAYTGPDVLLGVFTDRQQAEVVQNDYRARYIADPASDPWREQAYREGGLTADDLIVETLHAPAGTTGEVFVVSVYLEGFGQIVRKFDSLHASEAEAQTRMAELDAEYEDCVSYALLQRAHIDVRLSDAPDEQPSIAAL